MLSDYEQYLKHKGEEFENTCIHCGTCCGAFEEECYSHLKKDEEGKYYCDIYENRLDLQQTVGGRDFLCVPIRNILSKHWLGSWRCAYKKYKNG